MVKFLVLWCRMNNWSANRAERWNRFALTSRSISTRKQYSHRQKWAGFGAVTQQPGLIFHRSVQNRQRVGSANCPKTKSDGWNGIAAISCRNSATSHNKTHAKCDHLFVQFVANAIGNTSNHALIRCATG